MLTAVCILWLAPLSSPDDVDRHIERGKAALENLEYQTAADELMIAASDKGATKAQRFEANLYAGMANVVIGHDVQARLNFLHVLQREPDHQLPPDTPPKILSFFELVRDEVKFTTGAAHPPDPVAPAKTPAGGVPWMLWAGGGALVLGALAATAVLGQALLVEQLLSTPSSPGDVRAGLVLWGRANTVAGPVVVVVSLAAGAGLLVWGLVE